MYEDAHLEAAYEDANGGDFFEWQAEVDHYCEDDYEDGTCGICGVELD